MSKEKLAEKWISEMQEMGMTPEDMLRVIKIAREKYKQIRRMSEGKCYSCGNTTTSKDNLCYGCKVGR